MNGLLECFHSLDLRVHKNKPFCWIFSEWENNEAQDFLSLLSAYLPFGSDVSASNHSATTTRGQKNETFSGIFFTWVDDLRTPRGQWTMRKMLFDSTLIFSCHLVFPPDFSYLINSNVTKSSTMPGCIETLKKKCVAAHPSSGHFNEKHRARSSITKERILMKGTQSVQ